MSKMTKPTASTPVPFDWKKCFPQIKLLGHRPLYVAMPCGGIDGHGHAMLKLSLPYKLQFFADIGGDMRSRVNSPLKPPARRNKSSRRTIYNGPCVVRPLELPLGIVYLSAKVGEGLC